MTDDLDATIRQNQAERFKILEGLYVRKQGGDAPCEVSVLAQHIGMDLAAAYDHICFLDDHGLVKKAGTRLRAIARLTHAGVVEVERVRAGEATQEFPAYIQNYIHVERMNQSQILQGTENSSATMTVTNITDDHRQNLETLFRSLRESADQIGLDEETRADLEHELDTGESQLRRRKPNAGALREVLKSVRTIFEGAGGALAAQYVPQIGELMKILGG